MANEKKRPEIFQTPLGELVFPWLNEPDTRYNKDGGTYQTLISIPETECQDLVAQLERIRDAEFATLDPQKAQSYSKKDVFELEFTRPPKDATEEEKEAFVPEPTGNYLFKTKMYKIVRPKNKDAFEQSPILIDRDESAVTVPIWGGTKARIRGQVVPWQNAAQKQVGVTLRLKAVQVFELVTGEGSVFSQFED